MLNEFEDRLNPDLPPTISVVLARVAMLVILGSAMLIAAIAHADPPRKGAKSRQAQSERRARAPRARSDATYRNCAAARDAGAAPIRRGDPGYSRRLDRDGDGIACE